MRQKVNLIRKALELGREKKIEQALLLVDSAILISNSNYRDFAFHAELLWMTKRFAEAAKSYQTALLFDKDHSFLFGAYTLLGVLYEKAKMPAIARLQYLKAVYFFENKKRKNERFFEYSNKRDYAVSLKLSGDERGWERMLKENQHILEEYVGKNREEVLEQYFKPFNGE